MQALLTARPSLVGLPLAALALAAAVTTTTGCYSGARAAADINASWRGRTVGELRSHWGRPYARAPQAGGELLLFSHLRRDFDLPSARGDVTLRDDRFDLEAELRPGAVWDVRTEVRALVDGAGRIVRVEGPSLRWGPPDDANLRWGTIFGLHAGFGTLDDTSFPLPSGGAYIGGMLGPTFGLVGFFSLVAGKDDAGGAMAFAWGMGAQWWPTMRLWLRAGPALTLDFDPGFDDPTLAPGATVGASYAAFRIGKLVLDVRVDATASTSAAFGSLGVGVNFN